MYSGWAFVDVDGTLIDQKGNSRPWIDSLFSTIKQYNLILVVWSGGGKEYAEKVINTIDYRNKHYRLRDKVDQFMWKGTPIAWSHIKPVWFVDDSAYIEKEHSTDGEKVFRVPFYNAKTMPEDTWLIKAAEDVVTFVNNYNKGGQKLVDLEAAEIFGSNK